MWTLAEELRVRAKTYWCKVVAAVFGRPIQILWPRRSPCTAAACCTQVQALASHAAAEHLLQHTWSVSSMER